MRAFVVHEPDPEARDTGLLDADGRKIFRAAPAMRPIGFDLTAAA